jgi:STE24 endopeptidase
MLVLQASSGLGSALFTILLLALLAGLVGAIGGIGVGRLSNPAGKYRLFYVLVLGPVALGAYGYVALAEFGPTVAAWFALEPGLVAAAIGNFAEFLAAGVVWLTAYAPTVLGMHEARDIDRPVSSSLLQMGRYVVAISAVLAIVSAPITSAGISLPFVSTAGVALVGCLRL